RHTRTAERAGSPGRSVFSEALTGVAPYAIKNSTCRAGTPKRGTREEPAYFDPHCRPPVTVFLRKIKGRVPVLAVSRQLPPAEQAKPASALAGHPTIERGNPMTRAALVRGVVLLLCLCLVAPACSRRASSSRDTATEEAEEKEEKRPPTVKPKPKAFFAF